MQHATCDLFINSFDFCLHLLNSVWTDVVHMIFEVAPKEIIVGIYVWWTWWPGPPTPKALWKSVDLTGHGYWTHHAGHPKWHSLYVSMHHAWKNVLSPCAVPWMTGMTSFCSCCCYRWFVVLSSSKMDPVCPCFLIACGMVHFAG
jgi:hypothetical protein